MYIYIIYKVLLKEDFDLFGTDKFNFIFRCFPVFPDLPTYLKSASVFINVYIFFSPVNFPGKILLQLCHVQVRSFGGFDVTLYENEITPFAKSGKWGGHSAYPLFLLFPRKSIAYRLLMYCDVPCCHQEMLNLSKSLWKIHDAKVFLHILVCLHLHPQNESQY